MARPRISEKEKKVRLNTTISPGARKVAEIMNMNIPSLIEQAIRIEYEQRKLNNPTIKVKYTESKWNSIIEELLEESK